MSQVEQPKYTVLKSEDGIEIREYPPMSVAEAEVHGERWKALNEGFRIIADYIFGNNLSTKTVSMTAPVTQQSHEKIAMTAPVSQIGIEDGWKVRFVMPASYTLDSLLKPNNRQIQLIGLRARKMVVIRFSGFNSDKNIDAHREILMKYIAHHHLSVVGANHGFL